MILAISDTHLGSVASNGRGIHHFIDDYLQPNQSDLDHLFLLGDIFDLWRRPNAEVIVENQKLLDKLGSLDTRIHYLSGNHDLVTRNIEEWLVTTEGVFAVSSWELLQGTVGEVRDVEALEYDGLHLRFCHGHQIDYWSALDFYETFCKAMCSTVVNDNSPNEEWDALLRFSGDLHSDFRSWIEQASGATMTDVIRTLAGPLEAPQDDVKLSGVEEWKILTDLTNTERFLQSVNQEASQNLRMGVDTVVSRLRGHLRAALWEETSREAVSIVDRLAFLWNTILQALNEYPTSCDIPKMILKALSDMKRLAGGVSIGLREYEYLIRGHGHQPYADSTTMTADVGCWLGNQGSYLEICDGAVKVRRWKRGS